MVMSIFFTIIIFKIVKIKMIDKDIRYWSTARYYFGKFLKEGSTQPVATRKALRHTNEDCFYTE